MKQPVVGILAHVDAGKTTLSEAMLYVSGTIRNFGRVDRKDTCLDTFYLERKRGITIFSKQAKVMYQELHMQLLDTPGHVDFSMEAERTLQVLDYAILVVSAGGGVQSHTETLWRLLEKYHIPVFVFVNKTDLWDGSKSALLKELGKTFGDGLVDFTLLKNEGERVCGADALLEEIAMCGESAMEEFLESGGFSTERISGLVAERKLFPCYFGSALKLEGVEAFLEGLRLYSRERSYPAQFGAKVYKISRDAGGNRLTHLKVTGGVLRVKGLLGEEKVDQIRRCFGDKYEAIPEAAAGELCAVTGPAGTYPGEGFGMEEESRKAALTPVMTYEVLPVDGTAAPVLLERLRTLEEEEPGLRVVWNEALAAIHVRIMGRVQLEILKELILSRFGIEVEFGAGEVVYRETIAAPAEGVGHFEPLRHYAEVHLLLEPLPEGSGLVFGSDVSEDELDLNWQRLILTHLAEREHPGVLAGAAITDMRITLVAGRAHNKHTEGGDFRQATYRAVRQGLKMTKSVLLEPVYAFVLRVPAACLGRAMSDIQRMAGSFETPQTDQEWATLSGEVPVVCALDYMNEVHAYTKGKGTLQLQNAGCRPCHNTEEVLAGIGYDSETDAENPTGSVFCVHGKGCYVNWNEVPEHMHIKAQVSWQREAEDTKGADGAHRAVRPGSGGCAGGKGADGGKELAAIMEREFGAARRKREAYYRQERLSLRRGAPAAEKKETDAGESYQKQQEKAKKKAPVEDYLLVDGYNIIYAWEELAELAKEDLSAARGRLMDILCDYQGYVKCRLILVFDAYRVKGGSGGTADYHNITVVYTKEAETADMYIEKVTKQIAGKHRVRVATSDGTEQMIILGHGATRISAREFAKEIERVRAQVRERLGGD